MSDIGRIVTLTVDRVDDRGIWLRSDSEPILLSRRDAASAVQPGEELSVFLYRDGSGHVRATLKHPHAQVGEFALLTVRAVGPYGAFLDWGVEKDLLVPFRHQPEKMEEGRSYLVRVALDREGRPFATARIEDYLEPRAEGLSEGDEIFLTLWQFTDLGAKVIVNHRFGGLLYRDELRPGSRPGNRLTGYVKRLREDGKIDVTLRKIGTKGAEEAREIVLVALKKSPEGFLPLNDESSPEKIRQMLGLSKKAFKKALGGLYKGGLVELTREGVRLKS
jgi:uncharacterized protein